MKKTVTKTEFVGVLVDLAMEQDKADTIDFGMLKIQEREAFELMANTVIDNFWSVPEDQREVVMLASLTKLLVENFVLNARLQGAES